jgi:hypothetical protein
MREKFIVVAVAVVIAVVVAVLVVAVEAATTRGQGPGLADDVQHGPRTRSGPGGWTTRAGRGGLCDATRAGARARVCEVFPCNTQRLTSRGYGETLEGTGDLLAAIALVLRNARLYAPCNRAFYIAEAAGARRGGAMAPTPMGSQWR